MRTNTALIYARRHATVSEEDFHKQADSLLENLHEKLEASGWRFIDACVGGNAETTGSPLIAGHHASTSRQLEPHVSSALSLQGYVEDLDIDGGDVEYSVSARMHACTGAGLHAPACTYHSG